MDKALETIKSGEVFANKRLERKNSKKKQPKTTAKTKTKINFKTNKQRDPKNPT